jgi:hypothetical protein
MNKNYFRNTNKDVTVYQNTIIKKCAYILFGIHKDEFIELGGKMIDDSSSYYIEKKYDGTPTGEVCAVLEYKGRRFALWSIEVPSSGDRESDGEEYFGAVEKLVNRKDVFIKQSIERFVKSQMDTFYIEKVGSLDKDWRNV